MEKGYRNLGCLMILLVPITFLGFFKTPYFVKFPRLDGLVDIILHFHFILASLWILMLIMQPLLIKNKKWETHKRVGKFSLIIFPLLILSTITLSINTIYSTGKFAYGYLPLADSVLLVTFYTISILNKKNTPVHMRYMIGTALVFLGPTIGRIGPILFDLSSFLTQHILYSLIYITLGILILKDRVGGKNYLPYVIIFISFIFHQLGFYIE